MIIAIKAIIGYQEIHLAIQSKKDAIIALQTRRMYEKQFVIPYYTSEYARFFAAHEYGKLAENEAIVIPPAIIASGNANKTDIIKPYIIQENLSNQALRKLWFTMYTTTDEL